MKHSFNPPVINPFEGYAFFDGLFIKTDSLCNPIRDRVFPILEEEQVFMCRQMRGTIECLRNQRNRGLDVLDIGTGSGAFAIFIDSVLNREDVQDLSTIHALDISRRALDVTQLNLKTNGCRNVQILDPQRYSDKSVGNKSQDIIIMNPPFSPTYPELKGVAWHAEAGHIGIDVFQEWIQYMPLHLRPGGLVIGYQMSPVRDGEIVALSKLSKALGSESTVRFYRIIPEDYDTSKFLEEMYHDYLELFSEKELKKEWTELKEWINKTAQKAPKLALVYYEATNRGGSGQVLEDIKPVWSDYKTSWENRIRAHRMVVNNVQEYKIELPLQSVISNIPVPRNSNPKFELHNEYWELRERNASEDELSMKKDKIVNATILRNVGKYIRDSGMLEEFDFILVDTTPILPGPEHTLHMQIHQECAFWAGKRLRERFSNEQIGELVKKYQLAVSKIHRRRLAPFFHPWFVFPNKLSGWARGCFSEMKEMEPIESVNGEVIKDVMTLSDEYCKELDKILISDEEQEEMFLLHAGDEIAYSTARLVRLTEGVSAKGRGANNIIYWGNHLLAYKQRLEAMQEPCPAIDLQACHWAVHHGLQNFASLIFGQDFFSVYMGMPLQLGVAEVPSRLYSLDEESSLPSEYGGGVWIWAGRIDGKPRIITCRLLLRSLMQFTLSMLVNTYSKVWTKASREKGDALRRRRFAHRNIETIDSIINQLDAQGMLDKIDTTTLGALTLLKASVSKDRLTAHDHSLKFHGVEKQSQPLKFYTEIAANIALMRAIRPGNSDECIRYARKVLLDSNKPAEYLNKFIDINYSIVPESMNLIIRTESFGVMFIHCLWQVLYHSLRCKIDRPDLFHRPLVHFNTQDRILDITIENPGKVPSSNKPCRDNSELKEFGDYFGATEVTGPEWNEEKKRWITGFKIPKSL